MRAQFVLTSHLQNTPMKLGMKLYDQLIVPITTYGCQLWAAHCLPRNFKNKPITEIYKDSATTQLNTDKMQMSYMKRILGTNRRAINVAIRGELGLLPTYITIITRCIKFARRILCSNDPLITKAVTAQKTLMTKGKKCWLGNIWILVSKMETGTENIDYVEIENITLIKDNLIEAFIAYWHHSLWGNPDQNCRLRIYRSIKMDFGFENYLEHPKVSERAAMLSYRISANDLGIEEGRRSDFSEGKGQCHACKNPRQTEDEVHLFICPKYESIRAALGISENMSEIDAISRLSKATVQTMEYLNQVQKERLKYTPKPSRKRTVKGNTSTNKKRKLTQKNTRLNRTI